MAVASAVLVIYHGGCADGMCAAWLFKKAFPEAEMLSAKYGDEAPDVTGKMVYIVDFSYPREVIERMYEQCEFLCVLDHHKTAKAALEHLPYCIINVDKSGGRLAWEYLVDFIPGFVGVVENELQSPRLYDRANPPAIVAYTEDRDLWKWEQPDSRAINAALRSYPMTDDAWNVFCHAIEGGNRQRLIYEGEAILRDQDSTVAAKAAQAHVVRISPSIVPTWNTWRVVNATTLVSETASALASETGVGCCWFETADGSRTYSLRTVRGSEIDVEEIAKCFGGGGHKSAAGFTLPYHNLHPWL